MNRASSILTKHESLKGFAQHGVQFNQILDGSGQAETTCPFCGKVKMYINLGNLLWDCKACGVSGNLQSFWNDKSLQDAKALGSEVSTELCNDRGLRVSTLKRWQVGWNGSVYTYPVHTQNKAGELRLSDLRRFAIGKPPLSTKGGKSGLLIPKKWIGHGKVWVCEGEWDAMAWSEVLWRSRVKEDVCGVCGAGNFPRAMTPLFKNREVIFLFDNDRPGQTGTARAWKALDGVAKERKRLEWPEGLEKGYDVRDLYQEHEQNVRTVMLSVKKALVKEAPMVDSGDGAVPKHMNTQEDVQPTGDGMTPEKVEKAYKKWLDMVDTDALDVMFGSVFANRIDADPLWLFLVAPPGGSKSELLMSLADAPLIHCTTSLTPHALISGMDFAGGDPSLIPMLIGKTLIVKDFTTILSMNQTAKDEIFGTLRDAYDGRTSKKFGNHIERVYEGKFGILAGVTQVIDKVANQDSILGERFIKYRLKRLGQGRSHKQTILKALANLVKKTTMREELREIGSKTLDLAIDPEKDIPNMTTAFMSKVADLAQWVAQLRATVDRERYTNRLTFKPVAEVGTRLATQFCTLAMGVGIYRRTKVLDDTIYRIVTHVAAGTIPDKIESVVSRLFISGEEEASTADVGEWTNLGGQTVRGILDDLAVLKIVHRPSRNTWVLSDTVLRTMHDLDMYARERAWKEKR